MLGGFLDSVADFSAKKLVTHPVTWMLIATITLILVGSTLWQQHKPTILAQEEYQLQLENVVFPQTPQWVPENWAPSVFEESGLTDLSVLDSSTAQKIAQAYSAQPWVKDVRKVEKRCKLVSIDLEFRKPVGLVEIGGKDLIPVDEEAVVLDGKYFPAELTQKTFRISIPLPIAGPALAGQPWLDQRIQGAAAIADVWGEHWKDLNLIRVVNRTRISNDSQSYRLLDFEIWTRDDIAIIWGNPPGQEVEGEASAQEKILALQKYIQANGPLRRTQAGNVLDIRSGSLRNKSTNLSRNFDDAIPR